MTNTEKLFFTEISKIKRVVSCRFIAGKWVDNREPTFNKSIISKNSIKTGYTIKGKELFKIVNVSTVLLYDKKVKTANSYKVDNLKPKFGFSKKQIEYGMQFLVKN